MEIQQQFTSTGERRSPIRLLLDARKLRDGGIGVYIENLIQALLPQKEVSISLIVRDRSEIDPTWIQKVEIMEDATPGYSLDEMFRFASRIDQDRFELFHSPHFTLPVGLRIPSIVTIHDLIHLRHPEKFYYPWIAKPWIRFSINKAKRVVVVSQSTFDDLVAVFPKKREKIRVIPNTIDPKLIDFSQSWRAANQTGVEYILGVFSNLKPHKGFFDLVNGYRNLIKRGEISRSTKLVVVGRGTENFLNDPQSDLPEGVIPKGIVSREELWRLYVGARCLVVPSFIEGFCLPALEAKVFRTPVVSRPIKSVLEILDQSDVVCSDLSQKALEQGILQGVRLNRRSPINESRFEKFSSIENAKKMIGVYQEGVIEAVQ